MIISVHSQRSNMAVSTWKQASGQTDAGSKDKRKPSYTQSQSDQRSYGCIHLQSSPEPPKNRMMFVDIMYAEKYVRILI